MAEQDTSQGRLTWYDSSRLATAAVSSHSVYVVIRGGDGDESRHGPKLRTYDTGNQQQQQQQCLRQRTTLL